MSALSDAMEARGKATPGPWAVHPIHATVDGASKSGVAPICGMLWPTNERTEEETEANADIIAAAPALVRRVQELEDWQAKALPWLEKVRDSLAPLKTGDYLDDSEGIQYELEQIKNLEKIIAEAKE